MKIIERKVVKKYIEIDEYEFPFGDLMDLLEELEGSDMMAPIVIYDGAISNCLEQEGVILTNSRGSSYIGPNHEAFYDALVKLNGEYQSGQME